MLSELEREIVTHLQDNGRMPFAMLADSLDVSEATIRRTVARLIDDGVIAITVVADPHLLGLEAIAWTGIRAAGPESVDLPSRLLAIQGIDYVVRTTGRFQVMCEVVARDLAGLNERLRLIRALPGVAATETFMHIDIVHQEYQWSRDASRSGHRRLYDVTEPNISDVDRRVLVALRQDGRRSFRQVARETGVPEHRVRSAFARLNDTGIARVMAVVNPERLGFNAMAWAGVRVSAGASVRDTAIALAQGHQIDYVAVCIGRYDILAELTCADKAELADSLDSMWLSGVAEIEVFDVLRLHYHDESVWSAGRVSALQDGNASTS